MSCSPLDVFEALAEEFRVAAIETNVVAPFSLDIGEDAYSAFYPDADDYSDGGPEKDEKAREIAQALRERLGQ